MTHAIVETGCVPPSPPRRDGAPWMPDVAIGVGLVVFTLLAHPVGQMLSRPFWEDESWVAVLTRLRWSVLPSFASSTPLGWLALARLVPGTGLQRSRGLVLAFAIAGVLAAFVITRRMTWPSRRAAWLAGGVVALVVASVPFALAQNEFKQYTADAFFALVLLGFGSWCERDGRPRAVVWLGVAAVVALPFSTTSAFVSVAVFVGVFSLAVLAREFGRVRTIAVVGAVVAVAFLLYFIAFVIPSDTRALRDFWRAQYLDAAPSRMLQQVWHLLERLDHSLAMPAAVAVALFGLAIMMLWRRGERVMAIAMPVIWIEMIIMGATHRYPFLNARTSHFLLVPSIMVIAIGLIDVLFSVARRHPRIATSAAFAFVLLFSAGVRTSWRAIALPDRDPRSQAEYVAAHMRSGDVVLLNLSANWGFAYYWPHGQLDIKRRRDLANGFVAEVRGIDAVYAAGRTDAQIRQAVHAALDRQHAGGGRLFIVRSDMSEAEQALWDKAFAAEHVSPSVALSGPEPLLVVAPSS